MQGRHDELRATVADLQGQLRAAVQEAAQYKAEVTLVRREAMAQVRGGRVFGAGPCCVWRHRVCLCVFLSVSVSLSLARAFSLAL